LIIPGNDLPGGSGFLEIPNVDKLIHFLIFGVWVSLCCLGIIRFNTNSNHIILFFFIAFLGLLFGYGMELFQKHFVPNRSYDVYDIWADGLGSFAGLTFSLLIYRKK